MTGGAVSWGCAAFSFRKKASENRISRITDGIKFAHAPGSPVQSGRRDPRAGEKVAYAHFFCLFLRKRIFRQARQTTSEYCRIREEFNKAWRESRPQKPCGDRVCRARGRCRAQRDGGVDGRGEKACASPLGVYAAAPPALLTQTHLPLHRGGERCADYRRCRFSPPLMSPPYKREPGRSLSTGNAREPIENRALMGYAMRRV